MKVYKWPLEVADVQQVLLPKNAQILSVQQQHGSLQLWALCHPEAEKVSRTICIHGTGHEVSEGTLKHISTFQLMDGCLVLHAFERTM